MNINNAILHVLDVGIGRPILSDQCLSFDDKVLNYLQNHVMKCIIVQEINKHKEAPPSF